MQHWNLPASLVLVGPHVSRIILVVLRAFGMWKMYEDFIAVMPSLPGLVGEFLARQMELRSGNSRDWGCSCDFWLLPWHQGAFKGKVKFGLQTSG